MSCDGCSRRQFLHGGLAAGAGLVILGQQGCGPGAPPLVEATVSEDGNVRLALADYPDLALHGAVTLNVLGAGKATSLLVLADKGTFVTLDAICTHAKCQLTYAPGKAEIECPCHGSEFSLSGEVLKGPAKGALHLYPTTFADDIVTIDVNNGPPVTNGILQVPIANYPTLATTGGQELVVPRGLSDRLLFVRTGDSTVSVTSSVCTHLGCDVAYDATTNQLDCPCHGSIFSVDGKVVQGPAAAPLRDYPTTFDGTTITVQVA